MKRGENLECMHEALPWMVLTRCLLCLCAGIWMYTFDTDGRITDIRFLRQPSRDEMARKVKLLMLQDACLRLLFDNVNMHMHIYMSLYPHEYVWMLPSRHICSHMLADLPIVGAECSSSCCMQFVSPPDYSAFKFDPTQWAGPYLEPDAARTQKMLTAATSFAGIWATGSCTTYTWAHAC